MHGRDAVAEVLGLREQGLGARRIAARTDLPVATVRDWLAGRVPRHSRPTGSEPRRACRRCGHERHRFADLPAAYVYLLGLYLGDGCISRHRRGVYRLRIFLDLRYPRIVDECEEAIREVLPANAVNRRERRSNYVDRPESSNVEVSAFSKRWPCLIPQHGPGRKHRRPIVLTAWQRALLDRHPERMLRGLVHSDGCRFINTGRGGWRCPRYGFVNSSEDILRIFCDACDRLGLRWTEARKGTGAQTIYVSRRADVERMDGFIGPKA